MWEWLAERTIRCSRTLTHGVDRKPTYLTITQRQMKSVWMFNSWYRSTYKGMLYKKYRLLSMVLEINLFITEPISRISCNNNAIKVPFYRCWPPSVELYSELALSPNIFLQHLGIFGKQFPGHVYTWWTQINVLMIRCLYNDDALRECFSTGRPQAVPQVSRELRGLYSYCYKQNTRRKILHILWMFLLVYIIVNRNVWDHFGEGIRCTIKAEKHCTKPLLLCGNDSYSC
jgi:hypothetical protein